MDKERKKNFILGLTGSALMLLILRSAFAGVVQASAAFLANLGWERVKKNKEKSHVDQH
jgi:hypothetical protein